MKKIRNIFRGNEGFTLIELLIVIVIIGVLAAIAVPNIAGLGDNANEQAVKSNMRTLLTEIEARKASGNTTGSTDDGYVPIEDLNAYVELKNMLDDSDFVPGTPTYDSYSIKATVDGTTYVISSGRLSTTS